MLIVAPLRAGTVLGVGTVVRVGGLVGVQQHRHLAGDVCQRGQHGGDAALPAVGEVTGVLVQGRKPDPAGQIDGD
jgi:hypothetical protein